MGLGTGKHCRQSNGKCDSDQIIGWTFSGMFNDIATILQVSDLTATRLKNKKVKMENYENLQKNCICLAWRKICNHSLNTINCYSCIVNGKSTKDIKKRKLTNTIQFRSC